MAVDCRELRSQQIEALVNTVIDLFPIRHGAVLRQSPEADLGVNLERPLLAFRRDGVVHLFDFGDYTPRLLAQTFSCHTEVHGGGSGVILCSEGCPAWSGKHAAATWSSKQLSCRLVACAGAVQQSNGDVDGDTGEIRRTFSQQGTEIDDID
jgi:hypothetical protein